MLDTIWQVCIIGISTHETLNRRRIKMNEFDEHKSDKGKIIIKFKNQKELNEFQLMMQWPEDREDFKSLVSPTNLTEVLI